MATKIDLGKIVPQKGVDYFDGQNGQDGTDETNGVDGQDGFSPTVSLSKNGKTTTLVFTDKNGEHTATITDGNDGQNGQDGRDGTNGTNGQDGVSPSVTVSTIQGGHQVTITDAEHPQGQSFDVMDGQGGGISDAPSDGKTYVRKDAEWVEGVEKSEVGMAIVPSTRTLDTVLGGKPNIITINKEVSVVNGITFDSDTMFGVCHVHGTRISSSTTTKSTIARFTCAESGTYFFSGCPRNISLESQSGPRLMLWDTVARRSYYVYANGAFINLVSGTTYSLSVEISVSYAVNNIDCIFLPIAVKGMPADAVQFADAVKEVYNMSKMPANVYNKTYTGEKIAIGKRRFRSYLADIKTQNTFDGEIRSKQGLAVYGAYGFQFFNGGYVSIFSVVTGEIEASFKFTTTTANSHCNQAQFAPEVESGYQFPLLYISHASNSGICEVMRVSTQSFTQIQQITIDVERFIHCNVFVGDDDYLYACGPEHGTGYYLIGRFRLPAISEGAEVVLTASDLIESAVDTTVTHSALTTQGNKVYGGNIFFVSGGSNENRREIRVYDSNSMKLKSVLPLSAVTTYEPEDMEIVDDRILLGTNGRFYYIEL